MAQDLLFVAMALDLLFVEVVRIFFGPRSVTSSWLVLIVWLLKNMRLGCWMYLHGGHREVPWTKQPVSPKQPKGPSKYREGYKFMTGMFHFELEVHLVNRNYFNHTSISGTERGI